MFNFFSKKKQKEGPPDAQKLIFANELVPEVTFDVYCTRGDSENVLRLLERGQK